MKNITKFFTVALLLLFCTNSFGWTIIKKRGEKHGDVTKYRRIVQNDERERLTCKGPGQEICEVMVTSLGSGSGSISYDAHDIAQINWGHNHIYDHFIISLGQLSGSYTWANQNSQGVMVTYHSTWSVIIDDEAYEIIINKI